MAKLIIIQLWHEKRPPQKTRSDRITAPASYYTPTSVSCHDGGQTFAPHVHFGVSHYVAAFMQDFMYLKTPISVESFMC